MARRALADVAAGILVFTTALFVFLEPVSEVVASASVAPAQGSVSCSITSGTLKFTPSSAPGTVGVVIKANAYPPSPCAGTSKLSDGTSVSISGASLNGQGTATASATAANACDLGTITVDLKWKSTPKISPTTLTYEGGTWLSSEPPQLPASGGNLESVTGSFGGSLSAVIKPILKSAWPPNPCAGTRPVTLSTSGGALSIGGSASS